MLLLLIAASGVGGWLGIARPALEFAARPGATTHTLVRIDPGLRLGQIAHLLRRRGVVRHAWAVVVLAVVRGDARRLEAGTYELGPGMTPGQILAVLAAGRVATVRVTLPEGLVTSQVLGRLRRAGIGSAGQLAQAGYDAHLRTAAGLPPASAGVRSPLEGYLFPSTYVFPAGTGASAAVARLLDQFRSEWTPQLAAAARANAGLNTLQAVTLASIVQREVARPRQMAQVAAVYLERLRRGMRLDADPTVLYALGRQGQTAALSGSELAVHSPYNTYRHHGLPPGPICNPGLAALEGVAHPAHTHALYFLTTPGGHLVLANTLAQQEANRRRYLSGAGAASATPAGPQPAN